MNSSRHLSEFKLLIDGLCPIKISYNGEVVIDDAVEQSIYFEGLRKWEQIQKDNPLISSININIVQFHHSIIDITGEETLYKALYNIVGRSDENERPE